MTKVLIVEDDLDVLQLVAITLRKAGLEVLEAHDGREGFQRVLTDRPELVLLDVVMPRMDGYTVTRLVKEALGSAAPPIIMLTALGQQIDVVRGYEAGAIDYITKPFSLRELVRHVLYTLSLFPPREGAPRKTTGTPIP
jgi:two-component system response regulator VicR